jgi:hypothetical protein
VPVPDLGFTETVVENANEGAEMMRNTKAGEKATNSTLAGINLAVPRRRTRQAK